MYIFSTFTLFLNYVTKYMTYFGGRYTNTKLNERQIQISQVNFRQISIDTIVIPIKMIHTQISIFLDNIQLKYFS